MSGVVGILLALAVTLATILWCALHAVSKDDDREGRDG